MKNYLILTIVLLFASKANGQASKFMPHFSHQIETGIIDGTVRASFAGTLYSLIGEYYIAGNYSKLGVSWGVDSLNLDDYFLSSDLSLIVEEAKKSQIVIISENHLKPQHRIFASKIITELSKHGYTHLGLEAFEHYKNNQLWDSTIVERGYPLNTLLTGMYTMEPKMGEVVRNAINSNYSLFAYERIKKIKGKERDEIQADHIIQYMNAHPGEKIVILCGFYHAIESDLKKRVVHNYMAKYLKDKLKTDPLTIYQDNFTEKFKSNEHPYIQSANVKEPSFFVDEKGALVRLTDHVDIEIVHPLTRNIHGRPDWLYQDETYQAVEVILDEEKTKYPVFVSAHIKGEEDGVPVDRIELKHKNLVRPLVLKPGEYTIRIYDGVEYVEYDEQVE